MNLIEECGGLTWPRSRSAASLGVMTQPIDVIESREALLDGYDKAIRNALDLTDASRTLVANSPAIALAVAQIALEEVGKAYLLLHAGSLGADPAAWRGFWKAWRNHERKSGAGFMFEWFNPVQVQLTGPDGKTWDGFPIRASFLAEKNAGLYLEIDGRSGRFVAPRDAVESGEALSRLTAVMMLASTAFKRLDVIRDTDTDFRFNAVSAIVARLEARFTLQQDVHKLLDEFGTQSPAHGLLVRDLKAAFPACWRATPQGAG